MPISTVRVSERLGRGKGADVAVPDAARVPVENGVTEEFQSLLGDQHDWLPVSGGVLTELCQ